MIEAARGVGNTPAFCGLAYIVLRDFDLSSFGNRVPQLSFEVFKPVAAHRLAPPAVCLLPGANEFAYHPEPHIRYLGPGRAEGENITVNATRSDWEVSLDQLQEIHSECGAVALVVSWFGTDLRADKCRIMPKVDNRASKPCRADGQWRALIAAEPKPYHWSMADRLLAARPPMPPSSLPFATSIGVV